MLRRVGVALVAMLCCPAARPAVMPFAQASGRQQHSLAPLALLHEPLPGAAALLPRLREIAEQIITFNISDGATHGNRSDYSTVFPEGSWATVDGRRSIFMTGNLARVLLAASQLFPEDADRYREAGLHWCDNFVSRQHNIVTSTGSNGGFWGIGYGCPGGGWYKNQDGLTVCSNGAQGLFDRDGWILLADTGTAVTALALGARLADPTSPRPAMYKLALRKYAEFVRYGCKTPPAGCQKCPPAGKGWILADGSVADGFFGSTGGEMKLDTQSYTVATALTGVAFFSMLGDLSEATPDQQAADQAPASAAVNWLLTTILPNGNIPGHLDGAVEVGTNESVPYCSEAFIAAELFLPAQTGGHAALIRSRLNDTVRFLVDNQLV
jgi:hypothetical protein